MKKVKLAIITTLVCEDDSIYLLEPGQLTLFSSGDRVEIEDGGNPAMIRRAGASTWACAKRVR